MITNQRRLVFDPLGGNAWRLCDPRVDERNAGRVIAYVERTASGEYDAVWIGLGAAPTRHPDRDDLLHTADRLLEATVTSTRSKPIPIAHLHPQRPARTRSHPR